MSIMIMSIMIMKGRLLMVMMAQDVHKEANTLYIHNDDGDDDEDEDEDLLASNNHRFQNGSRLRLHFICFMDSQFGKLNIEKGKVLQPVKTTTFS